MHGSMPSLGEKATYRHWVIKQGRTLSSHMNTIRQEAAVHIHTCQYSYK